MQVVAVHTIHHGAGEKRTVEQPGSLFDLDLPKDELAALMKAGAVREPTEQELALAELVASKRAAGKNKGASKGADAGTGGSDSQSGTGGADTQTGGGAGNDLI